MHAELKRMREKHPDWVWNRSDTHVLLGVPQSLEAFRTVVEPGNAFSPGVGTFGVSVWVYDPKEAKLHATEEMPLDVFTWRFAPGGVPILTCSWQAGPFDVSSELFTEGQWQGGRIGTHLTVTVSREKKAEEARHGRDAHGTHGQDARATEEAKHGQDVHATHGGDARATKEAAEETTAEEAAEGSVFVVVRSFGPAGGAVRQIQYDAGGRTLNVNGAPAAYLDAPADGFGAVSYRQEGSDIGAYLRDGLLPEAGAVDDDSGWASAALEFKLALAPGQSRVMHLQFPHHLGFPNRTLAASLSGPNHVENTDECRADFVQAWRERTGRVELTTPDERFTQAFYCQLAHLYMATVYNEVRISNISYPIWWLRDGVYVLNALDKGGLHEFARQACLNIAPRPAFGGFGSEGDGPGEGVWALTEHYYLTADRAYLERIYPSLVQRAELLLEMIHAKEPVRMFTEFGTPEAMLSPISDLMCLAANDGLIVGRMDWHFPVFWVNAHACAGLARVGRAAEDLGDAAAAAKYRAAADALHARLLAEVPRQFGQNDRDVTGIVWPTRVFTGQEPGVGAVFDAFWDKTRCPGGRHVPETLWTYFEAGQAHNYLYLCQRERTWVSLEYFLTHHTAPGLFTYHEGSGDENTFGLWQRVRGWDRIPFVTPHGWTAAELFLLLRDCMLHESMDGTGLVIGAGVPRAWIESGKPIGIANAPSHFGPCSWRLEAGRLTVTTARPAAGGYTIDLPGVELSGAKGGTLTRQADGAWHVDAQTGRFDCLAKKG
jgi:hypothetical protein